jgi:hypothetical protein
VLKAAHVFTRKIPVGFAEPTKQRVLAEIAERIRASAS